MVNAFFVSAQQKYKGTMVATKAGESLASQNPKMAEVRRDLTLIILRGLSPSAGEARYVKNKKKTLPFLLS